MRLTTNGTVIKAPAPPELEAQGLSVVKQSLLHRESGASPGVTQVVTVAIENDSLRMATETGGRRNNVTQARYTVCIRFCCPDIRAV